MTKRNSNARPLKQQTRPFQVLMPVDLRERLETVAREERRSLSAQVVVLMEEAIEARERASAA